MATVAEVIDSRAFSDFCGVESSNQVPDGDTLGYLYKDSQGNVIVSQAAAIHEMGHNVKVIYKTVPETEVMSLEKAVNYFTMRLHNNGWGDMEDMKEEIRNLIEPLAIDGEIHNKTVDKVAWVSWSVK